MSSINHPFFYAIIMIIAGIGIPLMAALNTGLGGKVQNPALATVILLTVGLFASVVVLFISGEEVSSPFRPTIPAYYYLSGFLFVFYISTITWVAPKFGIGNAIAFVLLGQLISMSVIDHFSLINSIHYPLTWQRTIGLLLMMAGVYMVVKRH